MTEIQLNMYHALALGAAMYALGLVLTKKILAEVPAVIFAGMPTVSCGSLITALGIICG